MQLLVVNSTLKLWRRC